MTDRIIDYSRFTTMESSEVARQVDPRRELRSSGDRSPDYYQKQQEREGGTWSGASMGGGTWAGRSR